jgi:hypothetical protein
MKERCHHGSRAAFCRPETVDEKLIKGKSFEISPKRDFPANVDMFDRDDVLLRGAALLTSIYTYFARFFYSPALVDVLHGR